MYEKEKEITDKIDVKEAIKMFQNLIFAENYKIAENHCRKLAIEALEKQIPKKPISFKRTAHDFQTEFCKHSGKSCEHIKTYNHEYKYTSYKCPCCEHLISDGTPSYCWNCGQAIDWSEVKKCDCKMARGVK